ncbi:MAG: hypothetical protein Q8N08_05140 [Methanobacteriaceae archaeon]|nr:hypothetical protein [Methanobacteriaceae archaeon]
MDLERETAMRFKRGDPFDIPERPELCEVYVAWFFDRIKTIITEENHIYKWKGVDSILQLLHESAEELGISVIFIYSNGQWYINGFSSGEDFLNLPVLAKRFSKLYRFQSGQSTSPKESLNGKKNKKIR